MKLLRSIRIALSVMLMASAVAWWLTGRVENVPATLALRLQIIPSALGVTIGATAFWLVVTFVVGRFYCSTVCPLGTLQDLSLWGGRLMRRRSRELRYMHPSRLRWQVLLVYVISLLAGLLAVGCLVEPWSVMSGAASIFRDTGAYWARLGVNAIFGICSSVAVVIAVAVWAFFSGRRFCTEICPIGSVLGAVSERSIYHIEIDPDRCTSCMRCEEVCPSHCVKVVSRYVDNSRCVRCLDCMAECPDDAIRLQRDRNRRRTPLMQRRQAAKNTF